VKTVAVKFCGGCNPTYDRRQWWEKIKAATEGAIEWAIPDQPGVDVLLLICGCHTACPEQHFNTADYRRVILVIDGRTTPEIITEQLSAAYENRL
jgi:hypothetical protein